MRLEHLRITAFGPFAGTVEVDFSELSDAGLFLLTGATGAGKSSVLDAVCFALYGVVPGDRSDAKHLRSDHASPDATPEVELRATVRGRIFTFRRTALWERPKRRGTGTTRQQPTVCIEELVDGSWRSLATRMDDAGHLVTDLLGMTATQFTQVVMLPQGRFQAFLRATSAERHAVLQRLFRTDRFERIEQWLAEHRRRLRRDCDAHADDVTALLERISEVAEEPVPEELGELGAPVLDADIRAWVTGLVDAAAARLAEARIAAAAAADRHRAAASAHDAALTTERARQRGLEARVVLTTLEESADDAQERARTLADHHRAVPLRALLGQVDDAVRAHAETDGPVRACAAAAGLDDPALDDVAPLLAHALDEVAAAGAAAPLEERLTEASKDLAACTSACLSLDAEVTRLQTEVDALPDAVDGLGERLHAATTADARLDGLRAEVTRTIAGLEAAALVARLADEEEALRLTLQQRVDHAQQLREAHLTAREARINAMAGELAGNLAAGCSCPVCGSVDHPAPAQVDGGVGKVEEDTALRAYETAETERMATAEALAGLTAQLSAARAAAGGLDADGWRPLVEDARAALVAAEALAAERAELESALTAARAGLADATSRLEAARGESVAAGAARAAAERTHADLAAQIEVARAGFDHVSERLAAARERRDGLIMLKEALEAANNARLRRDRAQQDLLDAAVGAGFDAADPTGSVSAALLDDDVAAEAEHYLRERERRAAAARAVLDDREVDDALAAERDDLETLAIALDAAAADSRRAEEAHTTTIRVHTRLVALSEEQAAALARWAPVREAWQVAARLSALAEGTSGDNALKMRLSAYVLSERLRQVVAAANARLARMTDSRYSLEHTDERTVGAKRGGLGLWVRDDWTGARRDPATLSGGETFVVSLALALGLADTVTHEAGGTEIDTLFIDEGFGSLDSDTLDDVMDTLDSLREGGRVVGVVSHVPEMRERIPAGVDVVKERNGSRLTAR